jgi:hypothetical protein
MMTGNGGESGIGLDPFKQADTVQAGHHAIEQDQFEVCAGFLEQLPGSLATISGFDREWRLSFEIVDQNF